MNYFRLPPRSTLLGQILLSPVWTFAIAIQIAKRASWGSELLQTNWIVFVAFILPWLHYIIVRSAIRDLANRRMLFQQTVGIFVSSVVLGILAVSGIL